MLRAYQRSERRGRGAMSACSFPTGPSRPGATGESVPFPEEYRRRLGELLLDSVARGDRGRREAWRAEVAGSM